MPTWTAVGVNFELREVLIEEPFALTGLCRIHSVRVVNHGDPKATSHLLKDKIHFEHDTRVFIVHEALKTGEWQDPWETRGPKPGGILCDMTLQNGRYQGAAVCPADIRQAIL